MKTGNSLPAEDAESIFLFSFDPAEKRETFRTQENKKCESYGNITILFENILFIALLWFLLITKA